MKEYKLKEKERRKNRVYTVATKTLYRKGYNRTSIRDIAKATDMTTAGLYYYFKSKEELLFQILNGHMTDMINGIEEISTDDLSPPDLIKAYIEYQIRSHCADRFRTKLVLIDDDCLTGEWYEKVKKMQRRYLGYWRKALTVYFKSEGMDEADISIDAHCLVGMCAWIYRWYDPKGPVTPEELALKIFNTFMFGLSNRNSQPAAEADSLSSHTP